MKKQLLGLMTILTVLGACQKNEVTSLSEDVTIYATIEEKDATRTVMDENNNILWSENDQIIAFMKSSYGYKYQVKPAFVGKSYADFSMVSSGNGSDLSAGNEWEHNVVYYPYSEDIECLKSGANYELEVNLPSEQVYAPDSFANGSMAMVAVSENNNITFKNVLGGIKLQLKGTQTVKSLKIEGKNNEKLSGAAVVTAYTDGNKPAITMASDASTSVTLNCGSGVQLNESTATEFYISLPPVVFTNGFSVTLTDNALQTYVIETDKTNSVLRSGILVMPSVKLESESIPEEDDDDMIPVSMVTLDKTILSLPLNFSYTLIAKVAPIDATDTKVTWLSDNPAVINVDQNGAFKTLSAGEANIIAQAGGCYGSCKITVIPQRADLVDYIDEYGVNHGKGIALGNVVWAPVNCGYKAMTSNNKGFPYGKLYQWGRKYGQGYNLTYDESEPNIMEGPISLKNGMSKEYENVFFSIANGDNWLSTDDIKLLWNSGTINTPVKTQYDPCPEGWRVPTESELRSLQRTRSSKTTINNQYGYCFSGCYSYVDLIPIVFLPAAGHRSGFSGSEEERRTGGNGSNWGTGHYWSSTAYNKGDSYYNYYWNEYFTCDEPLAYTYYYNSGNVYYHGLSDGKSVRCVQE